MEENKEEISNSNNINVINQDENLNKKNEELPEPEITEEEMKNIINYINNWDYEKYERDLEVREALLLLRDKMKKDEKEKEKQFNELKRKENLTSEKRDNKEEENIKNYFEEEKIEQDNKYYTKYNENNNINVFKDELSEQEKEFLEKNWNRSTRPEFGEKIVNEKGDKEKIIYNSDDKKEKKVNNFIYKINLFIIQNLKEKKNEKKMENVIYHKPELVPSMGKYI